jgi:Protein of unknown function (DUF1490)
MKGVFGMVLHGFLVKAAPTVMTGVVGVAAYEALRKAAGKAPLRKATVIATAWGIRVVREAERKAGAGAEQARLTVADVVAEAKQRAGEEAAPLTVVDSGDDHDH